MVWLYIEYKANRNNNKKDDFFLLKKQRSQLGGQRGQSHSRSTISTSLKMRKRTLTEALTVLARQFMRACSCPVMMKKRKRLDFYYWKCNFPLSPLRSVCRLVGQFNRDNNIISIASLHKFKFHLPCSYRSTCLDESNHRFLILVLCPFLMFKERGHFIGNVSRL